MRFAALVIAWVTVGCVEQRVVEIPLDDYGFEYGFIALRGEKGITRISGPFGIAGGELTFGVLPSYVLEDEEEEMLLVALPVGALERSVPLFDRARLDRLELVARGTVDLPVYERDSSGDVLIVALPPETMVFADALEGRFAPIDPPELALRVPFAPEECKRIDEKGLVPFGAAPSILPPDMSSEVDNFFFLELVDDERVLAMTPKGLHLVRAGQTYVPREVTPASPGNVVGGGATTLESHRWVGFAVDRAADRIWLVGAGGIDRVTVGTILELALGPTEMTLVRTTTSAMVFQNAKRIADGRMVVADAIGEVAIYDGSGFERLPPLPLTSSLEQVLRIHDTGDDAYPYFASTSGRLHLLNAARGAWESFDVPEEWLRNLTGEKIFKGTGLASTRTPSGELELWAAGTSSLLLHKIGAHAWEPYDVEYPPRFAGCSSVARPYPDLADDDGFDGIEAVGDDLFLTVRRCTAALQIRRTSPCVALLTVGGQDAVFLEVDLQAIDVSGNQVVLGGENGLLYRGTLR